MSKLKIHSFLYIKKLILIKENILNVSLSFPKKAFFKKTQAVVLNLKTLSIYFDCYSKTLNS